MERLRPWIGLLALAAFGCAQAPTAPRGGILLSPGDEGAGGASSAVPDLNASILAVTPALALSGLKVTPSPYQPIVTFATNVAATSEVMLGTAPGGLATVVGPTADYERTHKHALTGLVPGTTYYYRVRVTDQTAAVVTSAIASFTTAALTVTGIAVTTTPYDASFSWNTSAGTTGLVRYGATAIALGLSTPATPDLATSHHLDLMGLTPGSKLFFKVEATDPSGNTAVSKVMSFQTKALAFTEVLASSRTPTTVRLTWLSNVPTSSDGWKGQVGGALALSVSDATLTEAHDITITGLSPDTQYHVQARGADAAGNVVQSAPVTVTTLP